VPPWPGQENDCRLRLSLNTGMQAIKSFGCSFIHGSDLLDIDLEFITDPSKSTWPALIAKNLNLDYKCYARPGQGNFKIYCDILANSYKDDLCLYLINWTWSDRFDFVNSNEYWDTLRPGNDSKIEKLYYRYLHSQLCDTISSASYITSAAEHLRSLNCHFIMTYMDYNLLTPINFSWHDPRYLEILQQKLRDILVDFDGDNFLDWSRKNKFPVSDFWHPLEQAHRAAADYWLPAVKKLL
jgi:hypothetical protein